MIVIMSLNLKNQEDNLEIDGRGSAGAWTRATQICQEGEFETWAVGNLLLRSTYSLFFRLWLTRWNTSLAAPGALAHRLQRRNA